MSTGIGIAISGNVFQTRAGLGSSGGGLLLDEYGTNNKLAYSVRKLRTAYTGSCMRVRNESSVELDIGFDSSGNLDESTLITHCGGGDGFVVKWYDQSGNGGDVEQGVKTNQPQIVSSGAVLKENGKPIVTGRTVSAVGSSLELITPKITYLPSTGQYFFFSVTKTETSRSILYREDRRLQLIAQDGSTSTETRNDPNYLPNTYRRDGAAYTPIDRTEVYTTNLPQTLMTIDGSLDSSINNFALGQGPSGFNNWSMQEFIVYEGDKSSDESNIETAINGYYLIY
tara:strand:+ start:4555 stop:5406 length:852 start_codon:yes stop_codon:yes gene_type:complete